MSKWKDEYINLIYDHMSEGRKKNSFARRIGVSLMTVDRWLKDKKEFQESFVDGKHAYLESIERSLANRARGMSVPETKVFYDKSSGECVEHTVDKHYPPDTAAAVKILETNGPIADSESIDNNWNKSTTINHESSDGSMSPASPINMTPEMIKEFAEKLKDDF